MATEEIHKTDDQWREELSPEQYEVLRKGGTERAFTGKYWNVKQDGVYRCAGCGAELFSSATKFDSGTGWPRFHQPARRPGPPPGPPAPAPPSRPSPPRSRRAPTTRCSCGAPRSPAATAAATSAT